MTPSFHGGEGFFGDVGNCVSQDWLMMSAMRHEMPQSLRQPVALLNYFGKNVALFIER
jgi:hypothetical protein